MKEAEKELAHLKSEIGMMLDNIALLERLLKDRDKEYCGYSGPPKFSAAFGELKHRAVALKRRLSRVCSFYSPNFFR